MKPIKTEPDGYAVLGTVGLPIHATNVDNIKTYCGLNVDKTMSYHRGGIILGMIKGGKQYACKECLSHFA